MTPRDLGTNFDDAALHETGLNKCFRALVTASSDVLFRMSADWTKVRQISSTGFLAETTSPARSWLDEYVPRESQPEVRSAIAKAIRGKSVFELEHRVRRADGSIGWSLSRAVPVLNDAGEITEWFGAASDVTARKQGEEDLRASLRQREMLLREVNHRVKNNLEVIDSLLDLQADAVSDPHLREILMETSNRVHAIAEIHRLLSGSADLANVDMRSFVDDLRRRLFSIFAVDEKRVWAVIEVEPLRLDLQLAVPLGLILNEVVSNALRHAFPPDRTGTLTIAIHSHDGWIDTTVSDDGIGLPKPMRGDSLGFKLIDVLVAQLHGAVKVESSRGTSVSIRFPVAS
jgi:two-component sensor histidine kinase